MFLCVAPEMRAKLLHAKHTGYHWVAVLTQFPYFLKVKDKIVWKMKQLKIFGLEVSF